MYTAIYMCVTHCRKRPVQKHRRRPKTSTRPHVKTIVKTSLTTPYAPLVMSDVFFPVTPAYWKISGM
jgi:hypothetical protein